MDTETENPGAAPPGTLHGLFEAQAVRVPEACAVIQDGEHLTYAGLDARATVLARALHDRGIGASDLVAVALDRSPDLVAALLAVLKTGAAYLPLDTGYPAERIAYMLADARPACVLTDSATALRLPEAEFLLLDDLPAAAAGVRPPVAAVLPDEAAYVVYTSGSTGRPKGVVISHRSIVNYLLWMVDEFGVRADDRMLQKTPAGFDGAALEFFWPLVCGAALVLARPGGHREPEYLAELIERERITVAQFVPSMLPVFLEEDLAARCTSLRRVFSASEALPSPVARRFQERLEADLVNLYGPTETTVDAAFWRCAPEPGGATAPLGGPLRNMRLEVLDARLRRLPPGQVGEIYLAGVQLARGYLGRAGLTAERFVADPHGGPGERMYRTGDLGRKRPDGTAEFAGRADSQVKIRGVRVEPAEVEAALAGHPAVLQAAVAAEADPHGATRLVAYVVVSDRAVATPESIRDHLRKALPDTSVPSSVVFLDALPTTPNEKLDRSALAAAVPDPGARKARAAHGAPDAAAVLLDLVREVLRVDRATADDGFIGLGGDSISAIRLASRARQSGLRISTADVLRHHTLGDLARAARTGTDPADGPAAEAVGTFPPTPIMHWLRELGGPVDGFSQSMVLRTPADATRADLLACLQAILDRHDMLRARFPEPDGPGPWQPEVLPPSAVSADTCLEVVDAGDVAEQDLPALVRVGLERARARLGLSAARLVQAVWFRRGGLDQGRLAVCVQHLAIDGVSLRILQTDFEDAWRTLRQTGTARLDPVPEPFRHWARSLGRDAVGGRQAEAAYWSAAVDGPVTALVRRPVDPRLDVIATSSSRRLDLPPEQTQILLDRAPAVFGADVNTILITALALTLARWRDPDARRYHGDLLIGLEGHGREEARGGVDLSRTVGWFTSMFPLRLRLDGLEAPGPATGDGAVRRAAGEVGRQLAAVPDKGLGYGLLRYLNPETAARLAAGARPDVLFNYLGRFPETDGSDWAFDPDHDVAMDGADGALPLAFAVEVNCLTMRRAGRPVLGCVWRWADAVVGPGAARRLTDAWDETLARIAELAERAEPAPPRRPARRATDDFESEFHAF